nr:peptide chain release factor N(5)-glutamine methyltransferase [uncultured Capnocytophaga sp.]
MTLTALKQAFITGLPQYEPMEAESLFFLVLEECCGLSRAAYHLEPQRAMSKEAMAQITPILEALSRNEPIQYILQKAFFYGRDFYVDSNVLIPRQETNELVEEALRLMPLDTPLRVIDLCTGSGCIAITLKAERPLCEVWALDISPQALGVAQRNAQLYQAPIHLIQADLLELASLKQSFDIIISNPPYVRECEKASMAENVLKYEPHLALFVPDPIPLVFYEKIAQLALKHLCKGGYLLLEINQYLAPETLQLLSDKGFRKLRLQKDLQGNDRMIIAQL